MRCFGGKSLRILALDTSTLRAAIALSGARDSDPIASDPAEPALRHGRGLVPAIRALLDRQGLRPGDVEAIAVVIGPGSYTGLRIGLTAAKTLAFATGAVLVSLDSLEVIASNAPADAPRVAVAADAQRGDVYVAEFVREAGGLTRVAPTRIAPAEAWAKNLTSGTIVLGPALDRLAVAWPEGVRVGTIEQGHPQPGPLLALAVAAVGSGRRDDPWTLEPAYFRRSAAEDQWDHRS